MLKDKIKSLMINENEKDSKKKIENVVVFIVILIVTVIAINGIWGESKNEDNKQTTNDATRQLASTQEPSESVSDKDELERNLESILSNIAGVGKVKVLITYSESSEVVAMYNENSKNSVVEEKDSGRRNKNYNTDRYIERYYI